MLLLDVEMRFSNSPFKLLLVGGFSLSPFLQSEIIRVFRNTAIIVDRQHALTSVVRGAIAWGSGNVNLRSLRSPCHFGFATVNPLGLVLQENISLMNATPDFGFQNGPINWIVKKGDRLRLNARIELGGTLIHQEGDFPIKVIDIFNSGRDDPPPRSVSKVLRGLPLWQSTFRE
ncbi:actin-like ATPase domain-containing protein [Penicillium malachiteum]|uniref:actin-like ATPase domain-containing protein n=1 Tax=Penicillium malachiteum TaxID=1324776 RepID=UPI002546D53C|nr:actin-like ATPase domain-containing protein [Penicillium malachiteum]KAJ5721019.1 actin-like ATPase domain-containing protein [Penicillium malachiteum]